MKSNHHISLPKSTLLEFSDSGNLSYLDLSDNVIKYGKAKTYNTKENYYPDATEAYLSAEIETSVGRTRKKLHESRSKAIYNSTTNQWDYPVNKIVYDDNQLWRVVDWIIAQWARTSASMELVRNSSIIGNLSPDRFYFQYRKDIEKLVDLGKNILTVSKETHYIKPTIVLKNCKSTLLLNTTHFFSFKEWIVFALSPYSCICVVPKKYNYENESIMAFSDSIINTLLSEIVRFEVNYGDGRLVGHKDQLLKVQSFFNELHL